MQTFATPAPITAVLYVPAGRIRFTAGDQAQTTVEIAPADPAKGRDVKLAAQVTAAYADGTLHVTAPAGQRVLGPTGAVEVTVTLPAGSSVQAKAASAHLTITGHLNDVTYTSSQGTVSVADAATAALVTVDGDITIGRIHGDAEARTARGNISITDAAASTLTLRTQTGDISVAAVPGTSAALDAGTTIGRISNALTNHGTPALHIHATTTVGDITATSR